MARILIVDDEPPVREALAAQLEAMGHRCAEAGDGLQGLERMHEREFDLVITDVMMPYLNGFQFIKRALPYVEERTPILILSSVDDQDGIAAAVQAGAFDYLTKPVELAEARAVVESALEKREELVRLHGRWRGRGGPVPAEALGPEAGGPLEAEPDQEPAGVPVFKERHRMLTVAPPEPGRPPVEPSEDEDRVRHSFIGRLLRLFRRGEDAA